MYTYTCEYCGVTIEKEEKDSFLDELGFCCSAACALKMIDTYREEAEQDVKQADSN
jgi:hypothetical protein